MLEQGKLFHKTKDAEYVCTIPPHSVVLAISPEPYRLEVYDQRFGFYDIPLKPATDKKTQA